MQQSDEVSHALDAAKTAAEEAVGQLIDTDDSNDEGARAELDTAARDLEARLARTLSAQQLRESHATYGSARDVVDRLGREQALERDSSAANP